MSPSDSTRPSSSGSRSSDSWFQLFDLLPEAATVTREYDGVILAVNQAAARLYGWPKEEMLGQTVIDLGFYRDAREREWVLARLRDRESFANVERRFSTRSGHFRVGLFSGVRLVFEGQWALLVLVRDITALRTAMETRARALQQRADRYRMLAEETLDLPWQIDLQGRIVYVGPGIRRWGYEPGRLRSQSLFELLHRQDHRAVQARLAAHQAGDVVLHPLRVRLRCTDNAFRVFDVNSSPVFDDSGRVTGVHGIARDVHDQVEIQHRMQRQISEDPLTRLLNRRGFVRAVEQAVADSKLGEQQAALLFIDLDDFKQINDRAGHAAGDHYLRLIADAVKKVLRPVDRAARYGGDEFAVLLVGVDEATALRVAERVLATLEQIEPLREFASPDASSDGTRMADGQAGQRGVTQGSGAPPLRVSASIGVCLARPGLTADQWLKLADQAMYAAKHAGKNQIIICQSS